MLNETAQDRIGRQLRSMYESIPKGGIPDRIWKLLLQIERKRDFAPTKADAAPPASPK